MFSKISTILVNLLMTQARERHTPRRLTLQFSPEVSQDLNYIKNLTEFNNFKLLKRAKVFGQEEYFVMEEITGVDLPNIGRLGHLSISQDNHVKSIQKEESLKRARREFMPVHDPDRYSRYHGRYRSDHESNHESIKIYPKSPEIRRSPFRKNPNSPIRSTRKSTKTTPSFSQTFNFNDKFWQKMWYLGNRENRGNMRIQEAWLEGYSGIGVTISVLDDGLEGDHPDLRDNYSRFSKCIASG